MFQYFYVVAIGKIFLAESSIIGETSMATARISGGWFFSNLNSLPSPVPSSNTRIAPFGIWSNNVFSPSDLWGIISAFFKKPRECRSDDHSSLELILGLLMNEFMDKDNLCCSYVNLNPNLNTYQISSRKDIHWWCIDTNSQ